jgi:hypothetical protein
MKITLGGICALMLAVPVPALQVSQGHALGVELSVPFGTIAGRLLVLGEYLVFVDDQQPESSVVVPKEVIENLTSEGQNITILTREPVRNRSGGVRRLSFRAAPGSDPGIVTGWYGTGVARASSAAPVTSVSTSSTARTSQMTETYQARHNHRIGSCRGRLIVAPDQLSFESIDSVSHSRRWEFKSIKEIKNPNPYELELRPFAGSTYKLMLDGTGMDPAEFKQIADRVTSARSGDSR